MILYFSATGNSEYAAKRIGKETDDDVTGLFERITLKSTRSGPGSSSLPPMPGEFRASFSSG